MPFKQTGNSSFSIKSGGDHTLIHFIYKRSTYKIPYRRASLPHGQAIKFTVHSYSNISYKILLASARVMESPGLKQVLFPQGLPSIKPRPIPTSTTSAYQEVGSTSA